MFQNVIGVPCVVFEADQEYGARFSLILAYIKEIQFILCFKLCIKIKNKQITFNKSYESEVNGNSNSILKPLKRRKI